MYNEKLKITMHKPTDSIRFTVFYLCVLVRFKSKFTLSDYEKMINATSHENRLNSDIVQHYLFFATSQQAKLS